MPPASPEHYPGTPAAYNSPIIKLLQLRATLSDEDNVIAKRGTRGGIGLLTPPCINAICLVIPAISRISSGLNHQPIARQQTYECTCKNQMDIAVRIAKSRTDSVACNVTTGHNLAVARYASRSYTCNNQDDTGMQHSTETML